MAEDWNYTARAKLANERTVGSGPSLARERGRWMVHEEEQADDESTPWVAKLGKPTALSTLVVDEVSWLEDRNF